LQTKSNIIGFDGRLGKNPKREEMKKKANQCLKIVFFFFNIFVMHDEILKEQFKRLFAFEMVKLTHQRGANKFMSHKFAKISSKKISK